MKSLFKWNHRKADYKKRKKKKKKESKRKKSKTRTNIFVPKLLKRTILYQVGPQALRLTFEVCKAESYYPLALAAACGRHDVQKREDVDTHDAGLQELCSPGTGTVLWLCWQGDCRH